MSSFLDRDSRQIGWFTGNMGGYGGGYRGGWGILMEPVDSIGDVWRNSAVASAAHGGSRAIRSTIGSFFGGLAQWGSQLGHGLVSWMRGGDDDRDHHPYGPRTYGKQQMAGGTPIDTSTLEGFSAANKGFGEKSYADRLAAFVTANMGRIESSQYEGIKEEIVAANGNRQSLSAIENRVEATLHQASQSFSRNNVGDSGGYPPQQAGGGGIGGFFRGLFS